MTLHAVRGVALLPLLLCACGSSPSSTPAASTGAPTRTTPAGPAAVGGITSLRFSGPISGDMVTTDVNCSKNQPLFGPYQITATGTLAGKQLTLVVYLDRAGDLSSANVEVYEGPPGGPVAATPQWQTTGPHNGLRMFDQSSGLSISTDIPAVQDSGATGTLSVFGAITCAGAGSATPPSS